MRHYFDRNTLNNKQVPAHGTVVDLIVLLANL